MITNVFLSHHQFYIATRIATLSDVMTEIVGLNILDEFNCTVCVHLHGIFLTPCSFSVLSFGLAL